MIRLGDDSMVDAELAGTPSSPGICTANWAAFGPPPSYFIRSRAAASPLAVCPGRTGTCACAQIPLRRAQVDVALYGTGRDRLPTGDAGRYSGV